jgi:hypothetical protein
MNAEGWFPDPQQPGRLRFFDGTESLWDLRRLSVLDMKESNEFTKRPFAALQAG